MLKRPITFFTLSAVLTLVDFGFLGLLVAVLGPGYWVFFFLHALVMLFMAGYFLGSDHTELKYKDMLAELLDRIPEEDTEDEEG